MDWDHKEDIREWVAEQAAVDIGSTVPGLKHSLVIAGEVHHLPAIAPLYDIMTVKSEMPDFSDDDEYLPRYETLQANRQKRREAWKAALPDITVQLRDRQIRMLSDLVDKLAAKGTMEETAEQILAAALGQNAKADANDQEHEHEHAQAVDATALEVEAEPASATGTEQMKVLRRAEHPQVRALHALYAAVTDVRAIFTCRMLTCYMVQPLSPLICHCASCRSVQAEQMVVR